MHYRLSAASYRVHACSQVVPHTVRGAQYRNRGRCEHSNHYQLQNYHSWNLCHISKFNILVFSHDFHTRSRDSIVGVAKGYGLDGQDSTADRGKRFSLHIAYAGSGAHPASYTIDARNSSPRLELPGREADHSTLSNTEIKNSGAMPPLPMRLHGKVLN
jgi:hypothetical protein